MVKGQRAESQSRRRERAGAQPQSVRTLFASKMSVLSWSSVRIDDSMSTQIVRPGAVLLMSVSCSFRFEGESPPAYLARSSATRECELGLRREE